MVSFSARREDHFQKNSLQICKIGLRNTLFIFGRKNCRLFVLFCLFVAILCPILAYVFLIEALIELKKKLLRKNDSMHGLGIAQPVPLKYPDSADSLHLQRCN